MQAIDFDSYLRADIAREEARRGPDEGLCSVCDDQDAVDDFSDIVPMCEDCWMKSECPDCDRRREVHSETDDCAFGRDI